MEYNRAQLKRDVKLSMKGTVPRPMLVALVFSIAVSAGTWLINTILGALLTGGGIGISETALYYLQQGYEVEDALNIAMLELLRMGPGAIFGAVVGGGVLSILVALWQGAMNVGYEGWCLSMVRRENPPMSGIFSALPRFGQVLVTRFLTGMFEFLWMLLLALAAVALLVAAALLFGSIEALIMLSVLVVYAALVLGMLWVFARYALVDYVLLDKGLSGMEAIRENKRLMKGNIGRVFLLQLSFIGWYLLMFAVIYAGIILAVIPFISQISASSTSGLIAASGFALVIIAVVVIAATVLSLWLKPYVTGTMARFYDWTQGRQAGFGGPGFGGGQGWGEHTGTGYSWTAGPTSGTGTGDGPAFGGGSGNGNDNGGPRAPKPPRDDPWN